MQTIQLTQRSDVRAARRAQYGKYAVLFPLLTFVGALPLGVANAPKPLMWACGMAFAAAVCGLIWWVRNRQLHRAAATGELVLSDAGLTARYAGTERHLTWEAITGLGPARYPHSERGQTGSLAGVAVSRGLALAEGAAAPQPVGVIGPGTWQDAGKQLQGTKLMQETLIAHGMDAATGLPLVPVWFADYEEDWANGRIGEAVRERRPDLFEAWLRTRAD